ncbi:MAG TPA: hypothetical protein VFM14_06075 [Gemmatimonadales bacterium]|nr:hypothetical protein [Gemmatimonadales bacterium]
MSAMPIRYLGWMTWDVVRGPGLGMVISGVVSGFVISTVTVVTTGSGGETAVFLSILDFTVTLFALLATAGMVSSDFAQGYYRTLFSRPMSPPLYYLLRWIVGGLAVLLAATLVGLAAAARVGAELPLTHVLLQASLLYLLVGGLVFVLSTFSRRDWLIGILVIAAHAGLGAARTFGFATSGIAGLLYRVLPPFGPVDMGEPAPRGVTLVYVLSYGLALVAAALAIIRFRPLARGARE